MTGGELLLLTRWEAGLTQREVADRLYVTHPAVAGAERRGDGITVHRLRQQLAAMGYDLHLSAKRRDYA